MSSALIRLAKGATGVPVPVVSLLSSTDQMETSLRRVISETPVERLFDGDGKLKATLGLTEVPTSWTTAEVALLHALLNWTHPWPMVLGPALDVCFKPMLDFSQLPLGDRPAQSVATFGGLRDCQDRSLAAASNANAVENAFNDALHQLQIAVTTLDAAQTDPSFYQQTYEVSRGLHALYLWQSDHDTALAVLADLGASAFYCPGNTAIAAAVAQTQPVASYFTNPNILLQVATLNQTFNNIEQNAIALAKRAQEVQTHYQALSIQLSTCIVLKTHWWGVQLVLDETCTKDLTDLLDLAIAAGLGVTVNIVTGTPPVSWLLALYWALVTIEAFVVDEVVKRTDKGEGVTMNISWIPIGLDTLASIASAGTAAPEIPFIIQAVEQATLLGELSNPGGGSLWYSFFWITAN